METDARSKTAPNSGTPVTWSRVRSALWLAGLLLLAPRSGLGEGGLAATYVSDGPKVRAAYKYERHNATHSVHADETRISLCVTRGNQQPYWVRFSIWPRMPLTIQAGQPLEVVVKAECDGAAGGHILKLYYVVHNRPEADRSDPRNRRLDCVRQSWAIGVSQKLPEREERFKITVPRPGPVQAPQEFSFMACLHPNTPASGKPDIAWRFRRGKPAPVRRIGGVVGHVRYCRPPARIKSSTGVEAPLVKGQAVTTDDTITADPGGRVKIEFARTDEFPPSYIYLGGPDRPSTVCIEEWVEADRRLKDRLRDRRRPFAVRVLRGFLRFLTRPRSEREGWKVRATGVLAAIRTDKVTCEMRGTDVAVLYDPGRKVAAYYLREGAIQLKTAQWTRDVKGSGQVAVTGGRPGPTQPLDMQQWARIERATGGAQPTAPTATTPPAPTPALPMPAVPRPALPTPAPQPMVAAAVPQALRDVRVGRGGTPPSFRGIVVGQSGSSQVAAALGPPRFIARNGPRGFACDHDGRALGLHAVAVRYEQGGQVGQLELRFASALPRADVARALGLGPPAASVPFAGCVVERHPDSRVELTVQGGAVTSLRLTGAPLGQPSRVGTMPQPTPPPTAPPPVPPAPAPVPARPTPTPAGAAPATLRQVQTVPAQAAGAQVPTTPQLAVRRVWYQADMHVAGERGLVVYADLTAAGCKGQQVTATVRLRQHTGQPVMAARGAPAQFVDPRGRFVAPAPDQVLHDLAQWRAYQVFVPYRLLALPAGQVHNLAIAFTATCKGQRTGMEALCTFRTP